MKIDIPGKEILDIKNLLLDYNGTLACDGILIHSVKEKIKSISDKGINVYLLTADSNGTASIQCRDIPINIHIFSNSNAAAMKKETAVKLGSINCACIGNGFNDGEMFDVCALSIAVIQTEGCSVKSLLKADIACKTIEDALDLIINPKRIIPTLRV